MRSRPQSHPGESILAFVIGAGLASFTTYAIVRCPPPESPAGQPSSATSVVTGLATGVATSAVTALLVAFLMKGYRRA
jgi:hypothetical protein